MRAHGLVESSAVLLELRYITVLSAISVVGWGLECVGYWLILNAFPGVEASVLLCVFLWSATTLLGATRGSARGVTSRVVGSGAWLGSFI